MGILAIGDRNGGVLPGPPLALAGLALRAFHLQSDLWGGEGVFTAPFLFEDASSDFPNNFKSALRSPSDFTSLGPRRKIAKYGVINDF